MHEILGSKGHSSRSRWNNICCRVSTTPGNPGNLLEFKNLLEILEISLNLIVLLEIFV